MYWLIIMIMGVYVYTLIRKSPKWCVFTQAWGYIVITSYLGVFKFDMVIPLVF